MQAIRRESSSSTAATWRSAATPWRAEGNGLPPPRWKKSSPKGSPHEATRHAVPAPLAILHRDQDRGARGRNSRRASLFRILVIPVTRERLYLFDTTLRDGAQT